MSSFLWECKKSTNLLINSSVFKSKRQQVSSPDILMRSSTPMEGVRLLGKKYLDRTPISEWGQVESIGAGIGDGAEAEVGTAEP